MSRSLSISLDLLRENIEAIQKSLCANSQFLLMVKANAYGHGICEVTDFCFHELGIKKFGVATAQEALEIRSSMTGDFDIYVFSEVQFDQKYANDLYAYERVVPVLSKMIDLDQFLSNSDWKNTEVVIMADTGMNRLGFKECELEKVCSKLKESKRSVKWLMTHFSTGDDLVDDFYSFQKNQFEKFYQIIESNGIEIKGRSLSNSSSVERGESDDQLVRVGLIAYGPSSMKAPDGENIRTELVSRLSLPILQVKNVKKGDRVGYGGKVCESSGTLVHLGGGYGDGIPFSLSGYNISFNGTKGSVFGKINMDILTLFFKENIEIDTERFYLWTCNEDLYKLAKYCKVSPYVLLTSITQRVERRYLCQK